MIEDDIMKKTLTANMKKTWGINVPPTKEFGNKIYSLIGGGFKEFLRTDLDEKKIEIVEVGADKKGRKIYALYYFGTEY